MRDKQRIVVMLGPDLHAKGGMSSIALIYESAGFFRRWRVHYITTYKDGSKLAKLLVAVRGLFSFVYVALRRDIALVHVHMATRASFYRKAVFILAARILRLPIVLHLHSGYFMRFYDQECGPLRRRFVRNIVCRAGHIIVLTFPRLAEIRGICPNARVTRITNPIGQVTVDSAPETARKPGTVLFLGRLSREKGVYDLLTACARLRHDYPDLTLWLCGEGDAQGVSNFAAQHGLLDRIKLLGWVEGSEKRRLLAQASIFVLPSYFEGVPVSVLEAMAASLPVVATSVGGIPELIDSGTDGVLVTPGDVDALAEAVDTLMADPDQRTLMGQKAATKIRAAFTPAKVLQPLDAIYRELGAQAVIGPDY